MRYTIRKHPSVEDDLFEIVDMVSAYSGLSVGSAKTNEITDFIESLADFPKIGTVRDALYLGLRVIPASEKPLFAFPSTTTPTPFSFCVSATLGRIGCLGFAIGADVVLAPSRSDFSPAGA